MPRIIIRIEITGAAKAGFSETAIRHGMTQINATDRLIDWLHKQPAGVQAAVLGQYPAEVEADVARLLLARMK